MAEKIQYPPEMTDPLERKKYRRQLRSNKKKKPNGEPAPEVQAKPDVTLPPPRQLSKKQQRKIHSVERHESRNTEEIVTFFARKGIPPLEDTHAKKTEGYGFMVWGPPQEMFDKFVARWEYEPEFYFFAGSKVIALGPVPSGPQILEQELNL